MTARDRTVLLVVAMLAVVGGFWFAVLGPKRKDAAAVADQVTVEQQRLETARQSIAGAEAARARYAEDYAIVARLGKAVPVQDDVPSLVYQLEATAKKSSVDFRSIKLESSGAPAPSPPPAPPAAQAAQAGQASNASTPAAPAANGAPASTTPAAPATPVPATPAAAAGLPPGAAVGPAGFPVMPFSFTFDGDFFSMEKFLRAVDQYTKAQGQTIKVRGRLLTIDGVSLTASRKGFPKVRASIAATAYLLPADQGLTAGATPQGPVPASTTSPAGSSGGAPTPTAAVTR